MLDKNPNPSTHLTRGHSALAASKLFGLLALFGVSAHAAITPPGGSLHTVTLGWNESPTTNLQGYRLYIGDKSGEYLQTYDAGTAVSYSVEFLEYGKTYYFAISAVDSAGVEGDLSSEIAVTIAPPPLPAVGGLATDASGRRTLNWSFPTAAAGSSPEFIIYASTDLVNWTEAGVVAAGDFTSGNDQVLAFSWPVTGTEKRKFFKLTARNWMGDSVLP